MVIATLGALLLVVVSYYVAPRWWAPRLMALDRWRSGVRERHVVVDGRRVRYLDGGRGPAIVMLHGFGATADHWTRMASGLARRFRVIAPDLPGFGGTAASIHERFVLPLQAARVHAFLRALGIRRYHLVASSMGGNLAGLLAREHADEVASLSLLEPQGIESRVPSELDVLIARGLAPLVPTSAGEFDRLAARVFVKRPFIPRAVYLHMRRQALALAPLHRAIWDDLWHPDHPYVLERSLAEIRAPALVIWGDSNRFLHDSALEKIAAALRGARIVRMAACGHTPMLERPAEARRHVEAFVASVEASWS